MRATTPGKKLMVVRSLNLLFTHRVNRLREVTHPGEHCGGLLLSTGKETVKGVTYGETVRLWCDHIWEQPQIPSLQCQRCCPGSLGKAGNTRSRAGNTRSAYVHDLMAPTLTLMLSHSHSRTLTRSLTLTLTLTLTLKLSHSNSLTHTLTLSLLHSHCRV